MLKTLTIKNYTLIDFIEIRFSPAFNILIGETGAGKSVIVGALMLALGGRAAVEHIRKGKDRAMIEAVLEFPEESRIFSLLDEIGAERTGNEIILRREVYARGSSRCFVNDSPLPLSRMKKLGESIAEFHGQHDSHQILRTENHIEILDAYAGSNNLLKTVREEFEKQYELIAAYRKSLSQEKELRLQYDAYNFELNEINKVNPQPHEAERLEEELKILENAEILFENSSALLQILFDGDNSVYNQLAEAENFINKLSDIDESFSTWQKELKSTAVTVDEIVNFARNYRENIDFNKEKAEQIRLRLSALNGLKKKYGNYDEVFTRIEFLQSKLALVNNFDNEIKQFQNRIHESKIKLGLAAEKLSELRKAKAKEFEKKIINKLKDLHLENAVFRVVFSHTVANSDERTKNVTAKTGDKELECSYKGIDEVEFHISANKGESVKPLALVASGGELSRIMLAIKSVMAERYKIPVLIFDEIDTGISGMVAQKVGLAIKDLAKFHQIIAITHLAQIAALGDKIISVRKNETAGKTTVNVKEESDESKIIEIAKLISGVNVSESSIETVNELLKDK